MHRYAKYKKEIINMKKLSLIAMLAVLTLGVVACKPATSSSETPAPSQQPSSEIVSSELVSSEEEVATLPAPWGEGETTYKEACSVRLVPGAGQKSVKDYLTTPGIRFIDMRDVSEGYGEGHIERFESISHFKVVAKLFNSDFTPKYKESVDILNELFPTDQT